jgi:hypothetical protein
MPQEPREELAALRHLLIALESGPMTVRQSGEDVTQLVGWVEPLRETHHLAARRAMMGFAKSSTHPTG